MAELNETTTSSRYSAKPRHKSGLFSNPGLRTGVRGLFNIIVTLLVIAYITIFGLIMAERGRARLPAQPATAAIEALTRTASYVFDHPDSYTWKKEVNTPFQLVSETLINSAGLLLTASVIAAVIGVSLGMAAALSHSRIGSSLVVVLSVLGMSTPSFLLGMLFWIFNIYVIHQWLQIPALPQAGFGWDTHMMLPSLVLAMRPLAQVAQITYVSLNDVMKQDYIRTARSKGASVRQINLRHAVRNVLIPILTTLGTSLRFSLASLPIVETFFAWPGVGLTLLQAIQQQNDPLTTDLIVSLGLFFLAFNLVLDMTYPFIDPRLRRLSGLNERQESPGLLDFIRGVKEYFASIWNDLLVLLGRRKPTTIPPLLVKIENGQVTEAPAQRRKKNGWYLRLIFGNPAFLVGLVLVAGLVFIAVYGEHLTSANPLQVHSVEIIEGEIGAPPFHPSPTFPWGTDHIGRDIQALVLAGAKRTLLLAFLAMVARMLLGTLLGIIAGWWQDSWLDRFINRLMSIWAAFPITIFAMLLIQALGIQQGLWVFVVALCVVGWGEVTQFVRAKTIHIKPQLFIEAARSLGARPGHLLAHQVFPNLVPSLFVIAALDMGGILMLLAELGFLNIFLGGGIQTEIFYTVFVTYSDVPEWSSLLANVREWWRSYPWMAWYPGVAFFIAIIAFNLFGEGLRNFVEESRVNLSRIFNRYTLIAAVGVAVAIAITMQSLSPMNAYRRDTRAFNADNVMNDIRVLSSDKYNGRESGTADARAAADYVVERIAEIGLMPSTPEGTYLTEFRTAHVHQTGLPFLQVTFPGQPDPTSYTYHKDFTEFGGILIAAGHAAGQIIGVAFGPETEDEGLYNRQFRQMDLQEQILILHETDLHRVDWSYVGGALVIREDPEAMTRRLLIDMLGARIYLPPVLTISEEMADTLLGTAETSLEQLAVKSETLGEGELYLTPPGALVEYGYDENIDEVGVFQGLDDTNQFVIGILPGTGSFTQSQTPGEMLDNQVTIISAHLDGVGRAPDGTLYPGANDNASGVATLLEIARVLKNAEYAPRRTVIFIVWTGGDRYQKLDLNLVLKSNFQLDGYTIMNVIELNGVGSGSGSAISITAGSSYRMIKLFQDAAAKFDVPTTTRGRNPHYNFPELPLVIPQNFPTLSISWDGSDEWAHMPEDTIERIDPDKLTKVGRTTLLMLFTILREIEY